jgi:hypothetical protein
MDGAVVIVRLVAIAAAITIAVTPMHAQQSASLADLARRVEKEQATSPKKATKTYTNASLSPLPDAPAPSSADAAAQVSATKTTGAAGNQSPEGGVVEAAAPIGNAGMPQGYWRERANYIRAEAEKALQRRALLEKEPINTAADGRRTDNNLKQVQQMLDGLQKQWDRLASGIATAKLPAAWIEPKPSFQ